ncbi:MAG: flagellar filament capping protein FliD, partial [Burkholderiaceae bacterium]|nr:flagellar filament capping protein FliD [Burkholderiaceae bacterium]
MASVDLIGALGAGSGVDIKSLAQSLVDAEKVPRERAINTKIDDQERRIAGYSAMMLSLENVKAAFQKLNDATDFNAGEVTNSQPNTIGAVTTAAAVPGRHTIEVLQLAAAQKDASNGFTATNQSLNSGNAFSLKLTKDGVAQTAIRVDDTTPQGIVDAINVADQGVKAQIINTGDATNPYTIVLTGAVGADGNFSFTTDDASGTAQVDTLTFTAPTANGTITVAGVPVDVTVGQSAADVAEAVRVALVAADFLTDFADRSVTAGSTAGTLSFQWGAADGANPLISFEDDGSTGVTLAKASPAATPFVAGASLTDVNLGATRLKDAADSRVVVDGLTVTRSSNAVDDVIPGVYIDLLSANVGTPADIRITRNTSVIKENLQAVVKAYNDAISDFGILTGARSDDETDIYSGSLAGDSSVRRIKAQLRDMFTGNSSTPGSAVNAFRDLGLDLDRTGVLSLDDKKLDAALSNHFDDVVTAFSANTNNQSEFGVANRGIAGDAIKSINDLISSRGAIMTQSEGSQTRIDEYKVKLEALNTRMEALLLRYTKQFGIMET